MTEEQITKLKEEMLDIIHGMSDEELQEDLDNYMKKRGLRVKMGFIDDAADVKPDFGYIKVGDIIYTQDDDKQGWIGKEVE